MNGRSPTIFNGVPVLIAMGPETVRRTFRERLFTRPWRPFQKYRVINATVQVGEVFQYGNRLLMRAETLAALKSELQKMVQP